MKAFLTSHNLKAEHFEAFKRLIGADKVNKALFITTAAVPYGFSPRPVWPANTNNAGMTPALLVFGDDNPYIFLLKSSESLSFATRNR